MSNVVMVIAPKVFRDEEYDHPKQVLEQHGHSITTASTRPGECVGKLGMRAEATMSVQDAAEKDWDAVVFVGGAGAQVFFDDPAAHALAHRVRDAGGIVAAICIAPSVLAHANMLQGVRATAFASQADDLVDHGATFTAEPVTVDGRIVTGNGPEAARDFGKALAGLLGE